MRNYSELQELQEKLDWLQSNSTAVSCTDVLMAHTLTDESVKELGGKALVKTWAEVENLIGNYGYEYYTTFKIDQNNDDILDLVLTPSFVLNPPCYSTKLFRCIAKDHNLEGNAKITFFNAEISGEKKIAIKVEDGAAVSLYDMTSDPI